MKITLALANDYTDLGIQAAALLAFRDTIIKPKLAHRLKAALADRGYEALSSPGKELWQAIENELGLADQAMLLLSLCESEVTLADFLTAYASPEGGKSIRRALEIVATPKPKPAPMSVPIRWRN